MYSLPTPQLLVLIKKQKKKHPPELFIILTILNLFLCSNINQKMTQQLLISSFDICSYKQAPFLKIIIATANYDVTKMILTSSAEEPREHKLNGKDSRLPFRSQR